VKDRGKWKFWIHALVMVTLASLIFALIPYLTALTERRDIGIWSLAVASFLRFYLWGALFFPVWWITRRLGVISGDNLGRPEKAFSMTAKLGEFLRRTLEAGNNQFVPLSEELEFLKVYLEIEQTRFSDKLVVDFQIARDLEDSLVPDLILQPIVENSIKHAISHRESGGLVQIAAHEIGERLRLQVCDNGPADGAAVGPAGSNGQLGLSLVKNRLAGLYQGEATIRMRDQNGGGSVVDIDIPLTFDPNIQSRVDVSGHGPPATAGCTGLAETLQHFGTQA
jgi:hypothetical protein